MGGRRFAAESVYGDDGWNCDMDNEGKSALELFGSVSHVVATTYVAARRCDLGP